MKYAILNRFLKSIILLFISVSLFTSCEKVIDVDLNSADPKLVVEAEITDDEGPYLVKLSRTANYFDVNNFPQETGARVVINDNNGNTDTLQEAAPGQYFTTKIRGIQNSSYTLTINTKGDIYSASSFMPAKVELDSIMTHLPEGLPFGPGRPGGKFVRVFFREPVGKGNNYLIRLYVNDTLASFSGGNAINQDNLQDGVNIDATLFGRSVYPGDSVSVELHSIDKAAYQYYFGLNELAPRGGGSSAAPANPPSNISGDAIGLFSARAVSQKWLIVK